MKSGRSSIILKREIIKMKMGIYSHFLFSVFRRRFRKLTPNLYICLKKSDLSTQFWVYRADKCQFN
jgi:hypothetical protein